MSISEFFECFGVCRRDPRRSWGAVRDDAVFLSVWQYETRTDSGRRYVRVASQASESNLAKTGYRERLSHIDLVKQGSACYMIICESTDVERSPRKIQNFNKTELSVGGKFVDLNNDGCTWVEVMGQVSSKSLFRTSPATVKT